MGIKSFMNARSERWALARGLEAVNLMECAHGMLMGPVIAMLDPERVSTTEVQGLAARFMELTPPALEWCRKFLRDNNEFLRFHPQRRLLPILETFQAKLASVASDSGSSGPDLLERLREVLLEFVGRDVVEYRNWVESMGPQCGLNFFKTDASGARKALKYWKPYVVALQREFATVA